MHACVLQFFIEQNGARREEHRGSREFAFTGTNRKILLPCHITESNFLDNSRRNSSSPSKSMKIGVVVCPIISSSSSLTSNKSCDASSSFRFASFSSSVNRPSLDASVSSSMRFEWKLWHFLHLVSHKKSGFYTGS